MRTTLTIDEDLAIAITREMKASDRSFKETINSLLRQGLAASKTSVKPAPFRVVARNMGRANIAIENIEDVLDAIEGPLRR